MNENRLSENFICFYFIALPRRFVILKVTLNVELIWAALYVLCKKKTA